MKSIKQVHYSVTFIFIQILTCEVLYPALLFILTLSLTLISTIYTSLITGFVIGINTFLIHTYHNTTFY